jgi:hypothetical protein
VLPPFTVKPKLVDAPAAREPFQVERTVMTVPFVVGEPFHTETTLCGEAMVTSTLQPVIGELPAVIALPDLPDHAHVIPSPVGSRAADRWECCACAVERKFRTRLRIAAATIRTTGGRVNHSRMAERELA